MIALKHIERDALSPALLPRFEAVVAVVGSDVFYQAFGRAMRDEVPLDRLYIFDGRKRSQALQQLMSETEPGKAAITTATYAEYLPIDPLQEAIEGAREDGAIVRLKVQPGDIANMVYRDLLEHAGVIERVSFVRKHGEGWRCMSVFRRQKSGVFSEDDLERLGGLYRLLTPLIDRHRELVGEVVKDRIERLEDLEGRFGLLYPALTGRERQICARAASGVSIEGAALDLGIGTASVLTYRKRAYHRLGVTSAYELAQLVLR